jgi:hypothetical protein
MPVLRSLNLGVEFVAMPSNAINDHASFAGEVFLINSIGLCQRTRFTEKLVSILVVIVSL